MLEGGGGKGKLFSEKNEKTLRKRNVNLLRI
jgi:hypothetical protein